MLASYALVGMPTDGNGTTSPGAARVFRRSTAGWVNVSQLTAVDGQHLDRFGQSVAGGGPTVFVGAPASTTTRDGASYVFRSAPGDLVAFLEAGDKVSWKVTGFGRSSTSRSVSMGGLNGELYIADTYNHVVREVSAGKDRAYILVGTWVPRLRRRRRVFWNRRSSITQRTSR